MPPRRYKPRGADRHEILLNAARYYRDTAPRGTTRDRSRELLGLAASVNDWEQNRNEETRAAAAGQYRPRNPWEAELLAAAQHMTVNRQSPQAVLARLEQAALQPE